MITTGIGVAGTTGVVIQNVINGGKTKTGKTKKVKEEDSPGEDPCSGERGEFNIARANLRGLLASREQVQNYLTMLETQYENSRQSSYWNGAVNVAMLGGSVFGRAARGVIGWTVARSLAKNVAVSMATALGSTVAKQVLQTLAGQGINPEDLVKGPLKSGQNAIVKNAIKEAVMQQQMNILGKGLNPNGPVYKAVLRGVDKNWASPAANLFGDTLSVLSTGVGIMDGAKKLEGIRGLMSRARSRLSSIDLDLMDARSEIELSQHSLDLCMNGESYAKYLRRVAFSRLPSQG